METNHINHQMYAVSNSSRFLHITKTVTQSIIEDGVIDNQVATTLCNKTFTWGSAWEIADNTNDAAKICKACANKAGK
jgi:hypothetical protein